MLMFNGMLCPISEQDRVIVDEFKEPVEYYKTFNEFFIRELKPGVRPIAYEDIDSVAVSAADSRLMAFNSSDDATRFWIKVPVSFS
jgi:phosphatidylserine decarboxylase